MGRQVADNMIRERIAFAQRSLEEAGRLTGEKTRRISARLDPGLVEAAMDRTGITSETALLEAALAMMAEPDDFGAWLISQRGKLDEDFELAI
jgi:hypothetical protein